jgi:hypothetical protein
VLEKEQMKILAEMPQQCELAEPRRQHKRPDSQSAKMRPQINADERRF